MQNTDGLQEKIMLQQLQMGRQRGESPEEKVLGRKLSILRSKCFGWFIEILGAKIP